MKVVVGLGNPGLEYRDTRHNVGFEVVERLSRLLAPGQAPRGAFNSAIIEAFDESEKIVLVQPLTFMNRSGSAVGEIMRFYKLDLEDLLVVVDDVSLPVGDLRFRASGSDGGHNGLSDIAAHLSSLEYHRLRVGIGEPGQIPRRNYVLGKFTQEQRADLDPALERAAKAVQRWATDGITTAMNEYNTRTPRPNSETCDN